MIRVLSIIKDERVGLSLGMNNSSIAQSQIVDGRYSDESWTLLIGELQGLELSFTGYTNQLGVSNGLGFSFLLDRAKARYDDKMLSEVIGSQMSRVYTIIKGFQADKISLSQAVISRPKDVKALYDEIAKLEQLLKV